MKLTLKEQNYDIGNCELLAIKLALGEWRYWLEAHNFIMLTDHRNLEYLREPKRLNPRQVRSALFFTCFDISISYRPGNKNVKADALSHLHAPDETPKNPEHLPTIVIFKKYIKNISE